MDKDQQKTKQTGKVKVILNASIITFMAISLFFVPDYAVAILLVLLCLFCLKIANNH
jgi:uncharacterized membrane protein YbaN (DUF454 family)